MRDPGEQIFSNASDKEGFWRSDDPTLIATTPAAISTATTTTTVVRGRRPIRLRERGGITGRTMPDDPLGAVGILAESWSKVAVNLMSCRPRRCQVNMLICIAGSTILVAALVAVSGLGAAKVKLCSITGDPASAPPRPPIRILTVC